MTDYFIKVKFEVEEYTDEIRDWITSYMGINQMVSNEDGKTMITFNIPATSLLELGRSGPTWLKETTVAEDVYNYLEELKTKPIENIKKITNFEDRYKTKLFSSSRISKYKRAVKR